MSTKLTGTVKWFSNRKGFGFIMPTSEESPTQEAIFVHQTGIFSDGDYRTLTEGAEVEFEIEKEESGKLKAINVTAPGGTSIKPPKRDRKPRVRKGNDDAANGEAEGDIPVDGAEGNETSAATKSNGRRKGGGEKKVPVGDRKPSDVKPRVPPFHDIINEDAKASIIAKGLDLGRKMTVDIAFDDSRIKLGQGGYAGLANAKGVVGEGTYVCDSDALVTFTWERCLTFSNGEWSSIDTGALLASLSLANDAIAAVGADETAEGLWGADKSDPKEALAANGFKMKSIVLTRPPGSTRGPRGPRRGARKDRE